MEIFGIKLNKLKYDNFLHNLIKIKNQTIVFTPNPEILLKSRKDNELKKMLNKANYLTSDGIGLYIAYQIISNNLRKKIGVLIIFFLPYYIFNLFFRKKYLYKKYGDRICGSDLTKDLINLAIKNQIKITIIDLFKPNDIKKVESQKNFTKKLQNKFSKLKFDYIIYNPLKKSEIIKNIKDSDSKILFSTLGMKFQEQSIIEILEECKNIKLGLGIGSSFDYFIGFQKRAPKIWSTLGFEWLYRLITGPQKIKRLKRLWNAIFVFIYEVIVSPKIASSGPVPSKKSSNN